MVRRYAKRSYRRGSSRPARFPSSTYGKLYAPRGTPFGLARYGATANLADPIQLSQRRADGWQGQGSYNPGKNFRKWATGAVRNVGRGVGGALNSTLLGAIASAGGGMGVSGGQGVYGGQDLVSSWVSYWFRLGD